MKETKKKGITVINAGCNQGVDKNGGSVECEGWAETINVA